MKLKTYRWLFVAILCLTFVTHFAYLRVTSTESDEWTYTNIAQQTMLYGFPSQDFLVGGAPHWFAFNPPFHFYLLSAWYQVTGGSDIYAGRLLSCFIAVIFNASIMLFVYSMSGSKEASLLVGLTMSIAGWSTYTSLLVKLDTTSALLGIVGLTLFSEAIYRDSVRKKSLWFTIFGGLFLGFATIYKHVGGYVFLAVFIHWVITRQQHKLHPVVLELIILAIVAFVACMFFVAKDDYGAALVIQIKRATGLQPARGLNSGIPELIEALKRTYWPYAGSILSLVLAGMLAAKKAIVNHWWKKEELWLAPLTSAVLASDLLLVSVKLANPHYLIYAEWSARALLSILAIQYLSKNGHWTKLVVAGIVFVSIMDIGTFAVRSLVFSKADGLTQMSVNLKTLPANAIFYSEEAICSMKIRPCYTFDTSTVKVGPNGIQPTHIVVQRTIALKEPDDASLQSLLSLSTEIVSMRASDAKSNFFVFRTPYAKDQ